MMNDDQVKNEAIEQLDKAIKAQIAVLGSGRAIAGNASSFNSLIEAKNTLMNMNSGNNKKEEDGNLTCEVCGTTGLTKAMYGRWHGKSCKKG